jgi:tRNA(fMet)-specific endonuclease VapC
MARRLILDSGVLIGAERSFALDSVVAPDDDVALAAITVAELRAGVELADERHRPSRAAFLARALELIPVELYDLSTAIAHGQLLAHVRRSGDQRGAHDLIIAATAIATRRTLITTDRAAKFDELPGVDCVVLT